MDPIMFPQANGQFVKPASMTDEQCGTLKVCKTAYESGDPVIISCWQLSPEELEEVNRTGVVWLHVMGFSMPPVSVEGLSSFTEESQIVPIEVYNPEQ